MRSEFQNTDEEIFAQIGREKLRTVKNLIMSSHDDDSAIKEPEEKSGSKLTNLRRSLIKPIA